MKMHFLISITLVSLAGAGLAQPITRTSTYDGSKVDATGTTVRDQTTGTVRRDANAVRASDGATATRTYDRSRTDAGVSASGSATGFAGKTSSFDYDRTRTENGYSAVGTATGRNGQTYTSTGSRTRTPEGYTRDRTVTNGSGATVYGRSVVGSRANGQISRNGSVTPARGVLRGRIARGRRN